MENNRAEKELLLEELRKEVAKLLCSDDLSDEEKLSRLKIAQSIIEKGQE